ncbi:MAG: hypothetical protein OQK32_00450 [Gammaproteobacteria bacterium]|nr:hypothetical protein [Gammaproteobacteria bacterium]MCW8924086.1 hypothetical protein [Gammaproteobacteria bacterium]
MPSPFARNPRFPVTPAVNTRKDENRYVEITKLPADKKQKLWSAIKEKRPALAELLGDSFVTELKRAFGATPMLTEQDYKSLMETENVS